MAPSSSSEYPLLRKPAFAFAAVIKDVSDDPSHLLQIALRTYSLCLSLSLGPVLLSTLFALAINPRSFTARARVFWRALSRELQPTGFALAMTTAVAGGAALQRLWDFPERRRTYHWPWVSYIISKLSLFQRTLLASAISSTFAVTLLRWKRNRRPGAMSPTLDLSLLFLVRALDASVQALLIQKGRDIATRQVQASSQNNMALPASGILSDTRLLGKHSEDFAKEWQNKATMHLDTFVFCASSARIMWCFFYQPQKLPSSFVRWINSLANVDKRLLEVLRGLRNGTWSYIRGSSTERDIAGSLAVELGRSPSWGDPTVLPAYGGSLANETWKQLGVEGRSGIGGMPCELVHGGIGATFGLENNCIANAAIRTAYAFVQALVFYLPVHILPILLTKPSSLLHPHRAFSILLSAIRSATFLSAFVSSCWFSVCFTRTLVLPHLFPKISHDVWDGPFGGTLAGSLACGTSIWIESARRRREVALYVLPKALRASIPENCLRRRHRIAQLAEYLTFILSLASLLTFSIHKPETLRGLSKWTLVFIMKGSNAGFWKKRRETITSPPASVHSPIASPADSRNHEH